MSKTFEKIIELLETQKMKNSAARDVINKYQKGQYKQLLSSDVGGILQKAKVIGLTEVYSVNLTFANGCKNLMKQAPLKKQVMTKKQLEGVKRSRNIMFDEFFKKLDNNIVKNIKDLDKYDCPPHQSNNKTPLLFINKNRPNALKKRQYISNQGWVQIWKDLDLFALNKMMLDPSDGPRVINEHSSKELTYTNASKDAAKNIGMILKQKNLKTTNANYWYKQGLLYYYAGINVPIRCDGCTALAFFHIVLYSKSSSQPVAIAVVEQGIGSINGHWWLLLSHSKHCLGWDDQGNLYPEQYVIDLWAAHRNKEKACVYVDHQKNQKAQYFDCSFQPDNKPFSQIKWNKDNQKKIHCIWSNKRW